MLLGFLSSFSIIKIRLQKTARKTYVEIKRKRIKRKKMIKPLAELSYLIKSYDLIKGVNQYYVFSDDDEKTFRELDMLGIVKQEQREKLMPSGVRMQRFWVLTDRGKELVVKLGGTE